MLTGFLLAIGIVMLFVLLRRTRQRKRQYRPFTTTVESAIAHETDRVFGALDAGVPNYRATFIAAREGQR